MKIETFSSLFFFYSFYFHFRPFGRETSSLFTRNLSSSRLGVALALEAFTCIYMHCGWSILDLTGYGLWIGHDGHATGAVKIEGGLSKYMHKWHIKHGDIFGNVLPLMGSKGSQGQL